MLICDFCKCAENTEKLLLRDVCKKCKPIILKYIDNRLKEIKIVWINDLNHPELKLIADIPVCIEEEEGDCFNRIENICVVCGTDKELTKHHVIPKCFLNFSKGKISAYRDILLLCIPCHNVVEKKYEILRNELQKYNDYSLDEIKKAKESRMALKTLNKRKHKIPESRILELKEKIDLKYSESDGHYLYKTIVEKFEPQEFFDIWRKFFVLSMNPKFLPKELVK